jgi:hypothetical protein
MIQTSKIERRFAPMNPANTYVAMLTLAVCAVTMVSANAQMPRALDTFEQLVLTKGAMRKLTTNGDAVAQPVSVKNGSGKLLDQIIVECGFYRAGSLVGSGSATLSNVSAGETAHGEPDMVAEGGADSTQCRISGAYYTPR